MSHKTLKQITETKYLSVENAWRYRTIMRLFYGYVQKFRHWLSKEDVFEEIRKQPHFGEYTLELCGQDLEALNNWGNLYAEQDTTKVATYQQFMNKQYRYQMTEYAVEIERMTVRLENIFIEGGSLEPVLLESIKLDLKEIKNMLEADPKVLGGWWGQLCSDFQRLNQHYQDYIRDWQSAKAEELMKTKSFLLYKEKLVEYLRSFIKELQQHVYEIEQILKSISAEEKQRLWDRITDYEMDIPRVDMEKIIRQELYDNTKGKYESMERFFLGVGTRESEVEIILSMTNEIIRRITRYAANILEMSSQYSSRREEYRMISEVFIAAPSLDKAHTFSAIVFGINSYRHFVGSFQKETESINASIWEESSHLQILAPRIRSFREKLAKTAIIDHQADKAAMLELVLKERREELSLLMVYLESGRVEFEHLNDVSSYVRRTLLRWLTKGLQEGGHVAVTEHGHRFRVKNPDECRRCYVHCEDGILEMPAYILEFEE